MHPPSDPTPTRWKVSQFASWIDLENIDSFLLFGGVGGRLIEVPESYHSIVKSLWENPNLSTDDDSKIHELFQDQGILVPESLDEVSLLERRYNRSRINPSQALNLTICPTLDCNFRCKYCYQRHLRGIMSKDVQKEVIQYIEDSDPSPSILSVNWFGGEPLLALSVIERLSNRFINLQNGRSKYKASIITNGFLLTNEVSRLLVDLQVTSAQITLDGPRHIHDARRPLKGSRPTFDRIVENIALADSGLRISIRVNIDQNNIESAHNLFDQLDRAGLRGRTSVYFAPVKTYTEVCADVSAFCIAERNWARYESQLRLEALKRGYGSSGLPRPEPRVCIADGAKGRVIGPTGLVYRCWNDVTFPRKAVGDLLNGLEANLLRENDRHWMSWNPFTFTECRTCSVLPFCMGGCPYLGLQRGRGYCDELKHNLRETVVTYYLLNKRRIAATKLARVLRQWVPNLVPDTEIAGKLE